MHILCYAQCRSQPLPNHTDAIALFCVSACAAMALVWFFGVIFLQVCQGNIIMSYLFKAEDRSSRFRLKV